MIQNDILKKFGDFYVADENTFKMGIDQRITTKIAERFTGLNVLETCTGAGFTTISLARAANGVYSIEINPENQKQARHNIDIAGLTDKVPFIAGDVMDDNLLRSLPRINAAFLDPDWNDKTAHHVFKFIKSNMNPPADRLFSRIQKITKNIALILPPLIPEDEFRALPRFELQKIYLNDDLVLFCLYFGSLIRIQGTSEMIIRD